MKRAVRRAAIAAGLLGALLVASLTIAVGVNAALCRSRQLRGVEPSAAVAPMPGFADRLGEAVALRTISPGSPGSPGPGPFLAFHELVAESFPGVHEHLDREVFGDLSLLYRWEGSDPSLDPILLMSHVDVVPIEEGTGDEWTHPPFSGRIADGFVWGRGSMDVKCGAIGLLEAAEALLAEGFEPASDVYFALGHDEETGGADGNRRIAEAMAERGVRFRFVLDEGGGITEGIIDGIDAPVAFVGVAEKGYATVVLSATGPEGHTSMPPPQTAVGRVASAIDRLEAHPAPSRIDGATAAMLDYLGPEMPWPRRAALANRWLTGGLIARQFSGKPSLNALIRTTAAATVVRGGATANVLPARAEATVNLRLLPGDDAESALGRIEGLLADEDVDCRLAGTLSEPSGVSSVDSAGFRALHRTIAEAFPDAVVAPGLSMVATDSRHYAPIAVDIYRFLPLRVTEADLERIHGTDERIAVDDYAALIDFLGRLIRRLSAPAE